jgi:hypothetical protein
MTIRTTTNAAMRGRARAGGMEVQTARVTVEEHISGASDSSIPTAEAALRHAVGWG